MPHRFGIAQQVQAVLVLVGRQAVKAAEEGPQRFFLGLAVQRAGDEDFRTVARGEDDEFALGVLLLKHKQGIPGGGGVENKLLPHSHRGSFMTSAYT